MTSVILSLPELFSAYKKWVSAHPMLASDLETTVKWVSYFIAGRINNSTVVSELIYCLSNLLVLFNDGIIRKEKKLVAPESGDRVRLWLTILEYSEVFLELSAKKLWGQRGKWAVIVILQTFKCISRLLLIFYHKSSIIENPPISVLKRKKIIDEERKLNADFGLNDGRTQLESVAFVLKRSGKVVRKVESAPPIGLRTWKPINVSNNNNEIIEKVTDMPLTDRQKIAELMYILKPLAHLFSVYRFGNNTWKPWMLSLIIDLTSIHLHKTSQNASMKTLNVKERLLISKRSFALSLYLLRSPFYERYSKDRVQAFLTSLGRNVPLAAIICKPLAHYIPHWQRTYFYTWST